MDRLYILGLLSFVMLGSLSGCLVKADTVSDLLNNAGSLMAKGQYSDALDIVNQALSIEPSSWVIWNNKGYILYNMGRYDETVDAFNQEIALHKSSDDISYALEYKGAALAKLGRYDEALDSENQALAILDTKSDAWYNGYKVTAWVSKGEALIGLGRYDEAVDTYNQVIAIDPNNSDAISGISEAMNQLGTTTDMQSSPMPSQVSDSQSDVTGYSDTNGLPDLTIIKLSMKQKGDIIAGTMTLKNTGTGDAGEFTINYFLTDTYYPDMVGGQVTILGSDTVSYLGAGADRDSSNVKMFTIPESVPAGTYWVGAFIDSDNVIYESNEENNVMYDPNQVQIE